MTRIIAGRAGGRTLRTPPGAGTRPTSDRVREALFSALDARGVVAGAAVLDLYAGSGALGLEAVSRGARSVDLVESDRRAASVISANAEGLGLPDVRLRVRAMTVTHHLAGSDTAYDLVFVDPPYDLSEAALADVLTALGAPGRLTDRALVVVERSSRSPEPSWPPDWTADRARKYGETTLWFASLLGFDT